ncbi:hypothetical protein [Microcoleus phage My-WqHQDG]|nr:hypothetical protein [Microcoleus phage My-WqHQDG]
MAESSATLSWMASAVSGPIGTPQWVTGVISTLMDSAKSSVISSTKDAAQTSKKGDSPGPISEPPKVSLQPMSEIVSATGGSGSYLQAAATTAETIKAVMVSHKETLEETKGHLHDHKGEAPKDMLEEIEMMLKGLTDSMKGRKLQQDKPTGIQFVSDSNSRWYSPTLDIGGENVSMIGIHGQSSFQTSSNNSKCAFNWHQISMHDVKFVHQNYEVRNAVVGTDSKSGVSNREYFNEISADAAHSISSTTKLHSINASDIEEKASNITSRALGRQDVQAGEGYTLSVGQGTAKGPAPAFFMAGGVGAIVAQKALQIGLSQVGGGAARGVLGGLVGNPTPGVVIKHTPQGSSYVTPKATNLIGAETTNITGIARRVVHGEAVNIANKLLADVSKGVKLEGVSGGVLTMITKKFSISMSGWMGELINKVIGEVIGCVEFPELPKLPTIALPRVPQISCMPPTGEERGGTVRNPPVPYNQGPGPHDHSGHINGVHTDKYPIWLEDALRGVGLSGKVALNQEAVRGTDGQVTHAPQDGANAVFGACLNIYSGRAPELGHPKPPPKPPGSKSSTSTSGGTIPRNPVSKGSPPGGTVDIEIKQDRISAEAQALLQSYASGTISKAEATSRAAALGSNITPYMDRSNTPATMADLLGVGGVANGKSPPSLSDVIGLISGGKSMAVGDVLEAVMGQIPGVKGENISLSQALQDLGLGKSIGKDGTLESAELLGMAMDKAGLKLPDGMLKVEGDTVSIDMDKAVDKAIDKAVSFLGDIDPIMKVDKLLKLVGLGTPITNLLNDLAACAKSWINIRAILKLPDIALDSISGKIGKITIPGLDLDFLKNWSLCGGGKKKGPILWDGVKPGQGGYTGDNTGTA